MRKIRALAVTGVVSAMVVIGTSVPAHADTRLSDVNMNAACQQQHPGTFADTKYYNAEGWRCWTSWSGGLVEVGGLNLNLYCANRHGGSGVYAHYTSYSNPFSWGCYRS